jgi:methylated-DNA-[protein]-cysteine S-methyltransferase
MVKECMNFYLPFKTQIGWLSLGGNIKGITELKFKKEKLTPSLPYFFYEVREKIKEYLLKQRKIITKTFPPSFPFFTNFSPTEYIVFKIVSQIPYGTLISYKELGEKTSLHPRVCGKILSKNLLPIIIPCHRVIKSNGTLGGYMGGGVGVKYRLLKLEGAL